MSRLAKTAIPLPSGVEVKTAKNQVEIKGPKGTLKREFPNGISVQVEENALKVNYDEASNLPRPMHGLHWSLIHNAVIGVSKGFEKHLSLIGVGYRAAIKGQMVDLQLGFSHPTQIEIPAGIEVAIEKSTLIKVSGIDKQAVGQFAADIRAKRPPEPYKGKGIRYVDEYVRKKITKRSKGS